MDALRGPTAPGAAPEGAGEAAAERKALLRLVATEGVGPVAIREAVEATGSARGAVAEASRSGVLVRAREPLAPPEVAAEILDRCEALGIACITWYDPGYPERLHHLDAPPPVLFVRGAVTALQCPAVAVVGSRDATAYGRRVAERFAAQLAGAGVAVLSGLARGVDGAAHRGALVGPAPTVAVVGGGVERASPRSHSALYRRILESGGAVVGEYLPGTRVQAFHFPVRNRLLAALSLGVLVVEAAARSGALITAARARELGREVMAVPGPVDRDTSKGTNALLRDGATPVLELRDILEAVGLGELALSPTGAGSGSGAAAPHGDRPSGRAGPSPGQAPLDPTTPEGQVWQALREPAGADEVVRRVGLPPGQVLAALTRLEVSGRVRREGGAAYRRAP